MVASGAAGGDPAEAEAEAEPLTYYIDPSVPAEWRIYMKTAVEAWRPAFQAAGLGDEAIRGGSDNVVLHMLPYFRVYRYVSVSTKRFIYLFIYSSFL